MYFAPLIPRHHQILKNWLTGLYTRIERAWKIDAKIGMRG